MPSRILFLHGLESLPGNQKQRMLESVVGKSNVVAPNLRTRQRIVQVTVVFVALQCIIIAASVICFVYSLWVAGALTCALSIILGITVYSFGTKYVAGRVLAQATAIAEKRALSLRPNMIAASSFGAMVAFQMKGAPLPLLLFAPGQDSYCRYTNISSPPSILNRPYTLIVHGAHDTTVPLSDSIRLIETAELGRCRLEVVDDDHSLKTLNEDDIRAMVREVYAAGKRNCVAMNQDGETEIDTTLFSSDEEGAGDSLKGKGEVKGND